jgi:hypothetical protein
MFAFYAPVIYLGAVNAWAGVVVKDLFAQVGDRRGRGVHPDLPLRVSACSVPVTCGYVRPLGFEPRIAGAVGTVTPPH